MKGLQNSGILNSRQCLLKAAEISVVQDILTLFARIETNHSLRMTPLTIAFIQLLPATGAAYVHRNADLKIL